MKALNRGLVFGALALALALLPATAAAQGVLYVVDDKVGVGTSTPGNTLHVVDSSASVAKRTLLRLDNNGAPGFYFKNNDSGNEWQFSMLTDNSFTASLAGTGGAEFNILTDGRVRMGPGSAVVFNLSPTGNLEIAGSLTESSDVNVKSDFAAVDSRQVLDKVASLPITTWRFNADPSGVRHLGPTAQDFYGAFGLGADDRHVSARDMASVALAAVQALEQKNAGLTAENAELKQRLDDLEALVASLAK